MPQTPSPYLTENLKLPFIAAAQSMKHVTVNEVFRALDALLHIAVIARDVSVPPADPVEGDRYIAGPNASGAWAGHDGHIAAWQDGAWAFHTPQEGWTAWSKADASQLVFRSGSWEPLGGDTQTLTGLGIGTDPDSVNKLAVKSAAALFTHDGDDHQIKVNKAALGDTASFLFQTDYEGRAEFGLTGDDDFHLKISPDGTAWADALHISSADAKVTIPSSLLSVETTADTKNPVITFADKSPGQKRIGAFNFVNDTGAAKGQFAYFFDKNTSANEYMRFVVNSVTQLYLGQGKVGVGLTNPVAALDVNGPVRVKSYTVAGAPSASQNGAGAMIYVSDETDGAVLAVSDGAQWLRTTDRAIIT